MKETLNNWKLWLVVSLTLGLAPFVPEPHIWGKLKWIMGGSVGMKPLDWYDTVQHGFPFVLLIRALLVNFMTKSKS
jgi:hypothetical protein